MSKIMNDYYQRAERLIKNVMEKELQIVIPEDGEDISCYGPTSLDVAIHQLIEARSAMAIGWKMDNLT